MPSLCPSSHEVENGELHVGTSFVDVSYRKVQCCTKGVIIVGKLNPSASRWTHIITMTPNLITEHVAVNKYELLQYNKWCHQSIGHIHTFNSCCQNRLLVQVLVPCKKHDTSLHKMILLQYESFYCTSTFRKRKNGLQELLLLQYMVGSGSTCHLGFTGSMYDGWVWSTMQLYKIRMQTTSRK
jgi:hypothetical protein